MHVGYLCHEYPPGAHGGIGSVTQRLARELVARGHRVTVVGFDPQVRTPVEEDDQGVRVLRLAAPGGRGLGVLRDADALRTALERVQAHTPLDVLEGPEMAFTWLARRGPLGAVTWLVRLHGGHHFFSATEGKPRRRLRAWAERRSLRRAHAICAVSRHVREVTVRELPWLGRRDIPVIPSPVQVPATAPRPMAERDARLVFVGTLCAKKGVEEAIDAFVQVAPDFPDHTLELIGRDSRDGPGGTSFRAALERRVPASLAGRVHFTGVRPHPEVLERLDRAAVFLFPTRTESLGMALLEAMAAGCACVSTAAGPIPEIADAEHSALLVPAGDTGALAQALRRVLSDAALRARLGAEGRRRVEAQFSVASLLPAHEALYRRLAARGGTP